MWKYTKVSKVNYIGLELLEIKASKVIYDLIFTVEIVILYP